MSPRVSRCRSCRAAIVWATVTASGKTMPVDASAHAEGTVRFVSGTATGPSVEVLGGDALLRARGEGAPLFRSHFATCPQAASHRRSAP